MTSTMLLQGSGNFIFYKHPSKPSCAMPYSCTPPSPKICYPTNYHTSVNNDVTMWPSNRLMLVPDKPITKESNHVWNVVLSSLKACTTSRYQLLGQRYAFT